MSELLEAEHPHWVAFRSEDGVGPTYRFTVDVPDGQRCAVCKDQAYIGVEFEAGLVWVCESHLFH